MVPSRSPKAMGLFVVLALRLEVCLPDTIADFDGIVFMLAENCWVLSTFFPIRGTR